MNVGIIGLGKLGLPVAYAMASRGLNVFGHDPRVSEPPSDCSHEAGLEETIRAAEGRMRFSTIERIVATCDVVLMAVQTPHDPRFEGITPIPDERADFDYTYLVQAAKHLAEEATKQHRDITLSVVSTVLPGTMHRHVIPILGDRVRLVYNPSFIAMGTTIRDFLDPEFVLIGGDEQGRVESLYQTIYGIDGPRFARTTVENAELIKVAYNTFIGLKIAFANTLMEVCHKTGCDVDEVTSALKLAHRRLISPAYLDGGMGDGGGCHPRDNIALSWLARELDLSYDLFNAAMEARERQAGWLCDLMEAYDLPKGIAGIEYKPESRITTGSPALLVKHILESRGHTVDVLPCEVKPRVWLIGCKHRAFSDLEFPTGSVVIDPFRYIRDQPGVEVIRVGQRPVPHHGQARASRELPARAA